MGERGCGWLWLGFVFGDIIDWGVLVETLDEEGKINYFKWQNNFAVFVGLEGRFWSSSWMLVLGVAVIIIEIRFSMEKCDPIAYSSPSPRKLDILTRQFALFLRKWIEGFVNLSGLCAVGIDELVVTSSLSRRAVLKKTSFAWKERMVWTNFSQFCSTTKRSNSVCEFYSVQSSWIGDWTRSM